MSQQKHHNTAETLPDLAQTHHTQQKHMTQQQSTTTKQKHTTQQRRDSAETHHNSAEMLHDSAETYYDSAETLYDSAVSRSSFEQVDLTVLFQRFYCEFVQVNFKVRC